MTFEVARDFGGTRQCLIGLCTDYQDGPFKLKVLNTAIFSFF